MLMPDSEMPLLGGRLFVSPVGVVVAWAQQTLAVSTAVIARRRIDNVDICISSFSAD
jgi:hypothetical protein